MLTISKTSIPAWFNLPKIGCERCNADHPGSLVTRSGGQGLTSVPCDCMDEYERQKKIGVLLKDTIFTEKMWRESTKEQCAKFIDNFSDILSEEVTLSLKSGESVYFGGNMNTGKTLLSMYIARKFIEAFIPTLLYPVGEVLRRFKNFNSDTHYTFYEQLMETPVLILDDLGMQMNTDFNDSTLLDVINGRYMRGKQTIVTGNKIITIQTQSELTNLLDRIFSKIERNYKTVYFTK